MHRLFALIAALALTTVAVSSACSASPAGALTFLLEPSGSNGAVQAHFRKSDERNNSWSSSFEIAQLAGLDLARFRAAGTSPVGFAIVREAGRIDCAGTGGNSLARGACRVTPNDAFLSMLEQRGIGRPDEEERYGLIVVDVRRDLVDALAAARYPTPDLDDLMGLTAVGVSRGYIADLARAGYRPDSLDTLLQFGALDISPEFIGRFASMGYANLPADDLVQLKALDITPEFIAGFERIGYGRLPAEDLVQLKALEVTPSYVLAFRQLGYRDLPIEKLVEMKALDVTPEFVRAVQRDQSALPSPDKLVKLRALGFEAGER